MYGNDGGDDNSDDGAMVTMVVRIVSGGVDDNDSVIQPNFI